MQCWRRTISELSKMLWYAHKHPFLFRSTCIKMMSMRLLCSYKTKCETSTLDVEEVAKFEKQSTDWWQSDSKFAVLRSMNALRVPLVRDGLLNSLSHKKTNLSKPLKNFRILDVGCGGGLFSEPLARLGASVTGLDPSPLNIKAATDHASLDVEIKDNLTYVCDSVESFRGKVEKFDAVVCSEVVEHVDNVQFFIECCVDHVKDNGSLFFTTINHTFVSYLVAIVAAEYVMGHIKKGTHDWNKFVNPEDLQSMLEHMGCRTVLVHGMLYNPVTSKMFWSSLNSVNYALHAIKER